MRDNFHADVALYSLLSGGGRAEIWRHMENCEWDGTQFHKGFRQYDVVDMRGVDAAIWHLIKQADYFWPVFGAVTGDNEEDGIVGARRKV